MLVGAPNEGIDGTAEQQSKIIQDLVREEPWRISPSVLKSCLASVSTDGHYAQGESSRHNPVRAFDCLFEDAGRQIRVLWDDIHRINISGSRATERCDAFQDWRQCPFDCESMFGFGQGRLLDRSITDYIGERFRVSKMPGGTRKFVYLLEAVERFFLKWPVLVIDIEVRRTHKQEESRGTKPLDWWIDFGKRMVHGKMIFYAAFEVYSCSGQAIYQVHAESHAFSFHQTEIVGIIDSEF